MKWIFLYFIQKSYPFYNKFFKLTLRNQLPQLQKRDFLTVDESMELRKTNHKLFEYIIHLGAITTKQRCMVIYGTQGELYLTVYTTVCTMFRVFYNDAWVGLNICEYGQSLMG